MSPGSRHHPPSRAVGFAAGTLIAYFLSRTVGLLGFEEDQTSTDAVIAMIAEMLAVLSLGGWLILAASESPIRTSRTNAPSPTNSASPSNSTSNHREATS